MVLDLGQVSGIIIGSTAPVNTTVLWYNNSIGTNKIYYYNTVTAAWTLLGASTFSVYIKTVNPTINDDNTLGYKVSDIWYNKTNNQLFVNTVVTTGAAVWNTVIASNYNGNSPSTVAVNDLPVGTNLTGLSYDQLFQHIYAPFRAPSITTFGIASMVTSTSGGLTNGDRAEKGITITSVTLNIAESLGDALFNIRTVQLGVLPTDTIPNSPVNTSFTKSGIALTYANSVPNRTFNYLATYTNYGNQTGSDFVNFIAPSFYGVGSNSLLTGLTTIAGVSTALPSSKQLLGTKVLNNQSFSASLQRVFYVYPQSLGTLTSIKDKNGFETIIGWTQTSVNFTLLDGSTSEPYYVYMLNNDTTDSALKYSFS